MPRTKKSKEERFQKFDDGWVRDLNTGLEWGPSSKEEMNWKDAEKYCKEQGARMPTREELSSLVDITKYNPAINKIFADTKSSYYWTSDTCAWNTSFAWCVGFIVGGVGDGSKGRR